LEVGTLNDSLIGIVCFYNAIFYGVLLRLIALLIILIPLERQICLLLIGVVIMLRLLLTLGAIELLSGNLVYDLLPI